MGIVTVFTLGFAAGGLVSWYVSKAVERFRRARLDWRTAIAGRRTLVEMMWRRGWSAFQWAALGGLIVIAVIFAMYRSNT